MHNMQKKTTQPKTSKKTPTKKTQIKKSKQNRTKRIKKMAESTLLQMNTTKLILIILGIITWTVWLHFREKKRTGKGLLDDLW